MYIMSFLAAYLKWHYGRAYREIYFHWGSFLLFVFHFFNIRLHTQTLFARFHRLGEEYHGSGFDVAEIASVFVINTLMRLIGVIIRSMVISVGILVLVLGGVGGALFFVVWTLYPLIICACIGFSIIGFLL